MKINIKEQLAKFEKDNVNPEYKALFAGLTQTVEGTLAVGDHGGKPLRYIPVGGSPDDIDHNGRDENLFVPGPGGSSVVELIRHCKAFDVAPPFVPGTRPSVKVGKPLGSGLKKENKLLGGGGGRGPEGTEGSLMPNASG
ncbi:unnamed protein product, partial [Choristocarpus tenellus]